LYIWQLHLKESIETSCKSKTHTDPTAEIFLQRLTYADFVTIRGSCYRLKKI